MPTIGQLLLLSLSVALLALGGQISLARIWRPTETLRVLAKGCMYLGIAAAVGVLAWHAAAQEHWQPFHDNFEALIWLALLLALFVMYMQRFRPIAGLDWFLMPIAILLLIGAGFFGRLEPHGYKTIGVDASLWLHYASSYTGAVAFAVAAAGGAMYVISSGRLRRKSAGPKLGSLERLERLMMVSVTLGFALLTVGMVTGFLRMFESSERPPYAKMLLASLAWAVYAIVMHAPINPRFRGRRAAILSVFGFVLIVGTLVVVQFMPGGGR